MTTAINLNNHSIWQDFAEITAKIDLNGVVNNHLKTALQYVLY